MRFSLLTLAAAGLLLASAMPAAAQSDRTTRFTAAPAGTADVGYVAPLVEARLIDEGIFYGHLNRPGSITAPPNRDVFGSFDPEDPLLSAVDYDPYPVSAFAGTVIGDLYYFVRQPADGDEVVGWYDFDTQEEGPEVAYTMYDGDGNVIEYADLPQFVDAGVNTDTGLMVLLGRATGGSGVYGCTAEHGASLFTLNPETAEGEFLMHFNDPAACPLSGAYDNENDRFIGLLPTTSEVVQVDLSTGDTVTIIPLPSDVFIASFIQAGATNYGVNDDPSDNDMWLFLFQDSAPGAGAYFSTARRAVFNASGVITGFDDFGQIDKTASYVEVLAGGFKNNAMLVANEPGAAPRGFEFIGAYPNPFTTSATVMLRSTEPVDQVSVRVYDLLGRQVAVLHDGPLSASTHHIALDGANLPTGVYAVQVQSGSFTQTQKVTLLR